MKPIFILLTATLLLGLTTFPGMAQQPPEPTASAAILMDYTTGKILYQKNAYERRFPASTTKILTAIVAIEKGNLKKIITADATAAKTDGSSIWLKAGERQTLKDLLYGILLNSGNDACVAVADSLAGSEKRFTSWMNTKAYEIGAKDSHFANSNGLPNPVHFTTAYDLSLITRYAMKNPVFAEIVRTKRKTIPWPGRDYDRVMINHNKLLWRYEYADGVKTGYTLEAGKCLVSSATKDNHRLIAVVLNSRDMYGASQRSSDYGFSHYQLLSLASPQETLSQVNVTEGIASQVPVSANRPLNLLIPKGDESKLRVNLELRSSLRAPVERMQQVGELQVKMGERLIEKVPVVTLARVPQKSWWRRIWDWLRGFIG